MARDVGADDVRCPGAGSSSALALDALPRRAAGGAGKLRNARRTRHLGRGAAFAANISSRRGCLSANLAFHRL